MSAQAVDPGPVGPALELHGPAYEWALWGTTVRLVTAEPAALRSAKRLVDDVLAHVELPPARTARRTACRRVGGCRPRRR